MDETDTVVEVDEIRLEEDTFKILLSTDNHLGYAEKDPIREHDSFIAFEEVLKTAVKENVDFILLAGDLFHDSRPSPYCYQKCTELLRKYCFGDRPVAIEFLSDQSYNFQNMNNPIVNYEDLNLNVAIPVFTIHGNHDDPVGQKQVSALDVLSSGGYVNYFGRWTEMTYVEISPILLQKGQTKLALYGLSHIRDERLGRLFRNKKVSFLKPPNDEWFNILVLHQNRAVRGTKNFIPESAIPDFFHLVVWGHEHDCRIEIEDCTDFYVTQPGSTVVTSLSRGEAIAKKIAVLNVNKQAFVMEPILLKTARPFIFDEISLLRNDEEGYNFEDPNKQAEIAAKRKVLEMIEEAKTKYPDNTMLPLIRLKVNYFEENQQFNTVRFGQRFIDLVANPQDVVILKHTKLGIDGTKVKGDFDDEMFENTNDLAERVEDLVKKYLEQSETKMDVLSVKGMTESVINFIDKNDEETLPEMIDAESKLVLNKMFEMDPDVEEADEYIQRIKNWRITQDTDVVLPERRQNGRSQARSSDDYIEMNSSNEDEPTTFARKTSPRGGPGSRGKRGAKTTGSRAKKANDKQANNIDVTFDSDEDFNISPPKPSRGKGSRGGRGSRARGKARM